MTQTYLSSEGSLDAPITCSDKAKRCLHSCALGKDAINGQFSFSW